MSGDSSSSKSDKSQYERQQQKEVDTDIREELDEDLDNLRALLQKGAPNAAGPSRMHPSRQIALRPEDADVDYDQVVRTLAFDARSKPKNRTKTEEELAMEEKERLEVAEAKRLRRMRGEESEDEDEAGSRKRRKKDGRRPDGDDLEGDFEDEEDLLGPGLTREALENMQLPTVESDVDEEGESGSEVDEDKEETDEDEDDDGEEGESSGEASAMEDLNDDVAMALPEPPKLTIAPALSLQRRSANLVKKEIPYTFACPSSIEEFEDILDGLEDSALPTVVQRIRVLHHPSLAQGNKEKLQVGFVEPSMT